MTTLAGIRGYGQDIVPELLALRFSPAVVPLEDRDYKLGRPVDDLGERSVNRVHSLCPAAS